MPDPRACAFAAGCFLYLFVLPHPLLETDTFLHLAVGREVATAGVPRADPFSYTRAGQPWEAHSWLFGWLLFRAHAFGGPGFLVWLAACALVLTVLATGPSYVARSVALLLLGATFCVRPHVVSGLLLAVASCLLARWLRTGERWPLFAMPPLCMVWANTHGGFVLAALPFVQVALTAGGRRRLAELAAAAVASAAASCVNPWGITLLALPFRFAAGNEALRTIAEWMPPDLATCGWQLAITAAVLILIATRTRPMEPGDALALAAATALWLTSRRHLPVFAIIAAPLLARALARPGEAVRSPPSGQALAFVLAAGLALVVADFRSFIPPGQLPRTCVYLIQREPTSGPVFHEGAVGGYLIWQRIPVYIDWRAELYAGTDILAEYNALLQLEPGWQEILERRRFRWVLIFRHRPLARALAARPDWTLVCHDDSYALFRKDRTAHGDTDGTEGARRGRGTSVGPR